MEVQNRVIPLRDIELHPDNDNEHPVDQVAYLRDGLEKFGQVRSVVVQEMPSGGYLMVAGEGVLTAARQEGVHELRADVIPPDWPEEKVLAYLRADNLSGRMSKTDREKSEDIIARVAAKGDRQLAVLAAGNEKRLREVIDRMAGRPAPTPKKPKTDRYSASDVPDALWASDNEYGIPTLIRTRQADALDLPVDLWGSRKGGRAREMRGTWAFYTDDYRFRAVWDSPYKVPNTSCVSVIEPNWTTNDQMPAAVAIFRTYQKRWVCRWWQSLGIRVFVDLNVDPAYHELNLLGVPDGWTAFVTRGYNHALELLDVEYELACSKAGDEEPLFVVYGGGQAVTKLCLERSWIWVPEQRDEVRGRRMFVPERYDGKVKQQGEKQGKG